MTNDSVILVKKSVQYKILIMNIMKSLDATFQWVIFSMHIFVRNISVIHFNTDTYRGSLRFQERKPKFFHINSNIS